MIPSSLRFPYSLTLGNQSSLDQTKKDGVFNTSEDHKASASPKNDLTSWEGGGLLGHK